MKSATTERDPNLTAAYVTVCAAGALLFVGAGIAFGVRTMLAVGLGAALAVSNLWVLERLVSAYLKTTGGRWTAIATVKAALLVAMVALLVKSGAVDILPIIAGFGALPVGIVFSGLLPMPTRPEES
jgi:hypothetical protein